MDYHIKNVSTAEVVYCVILLEMSAVLLFGRDMIGRQLLKL